MPRLFRQLADGRPRFIAEIDGVYRTVDGDPFDGWTAGPPVSIDDGAAWLAPVAPGKIVGIGRNYRGHAAERGKPVPAEPLVFLKPASAVIGPGAPIEIPPGIGRVDHEAELGLVIGRRASRVPRARALEYVLGVTAVNDVTARDLQNRGAPFSHVKGYDTFAPVGPCVALGLDPRGLTVEGVVNGELRQRGTTADLIFPVDVLIEYVSAIMTLEPGDIIATGTPAGVGPLVPGDTVTVRVEGVGELTNPVVGRTG
jgi:2-keto-4-pentenoate hydratase/2-oxohepta-3-ene-1,7-dioic acid hydratase in catechol pathway